MKKLRIEIGKFPEPVLRALRERDAALWIGQPKSPAADWRESIARLASLPWKIILCESSSPDLIKALQSDASSDANISRTRGFVHIVASDPEGVELPPRSLPMLLLNGRADGKDESELPSLGSFARMRRRLNMMKVLIGKRPRLLVVVSDGTEQPLDDLLVLWKEEGFRSLITIVSSSKDDEERVDKWLLEPNAPNAIDQCLGDLSSSVSDLQERLKVELPDSRLFVRLRTSNGATSDFDITECDLIERPLLDRYELIQPNDLRLLQHHELSREDIEGFFSRSTNGWKPFAAGLPWRRAPEAQTSLLNALRNVAESGPEENRILSIVSESGAGGSTLARSIAFAAACEGFPALVARPGAGDFSPLELSRFLYAVALSVTPALAPGAQSRGANDGHDEVPWVIVFDVEHWEGREGDLRGFLSAMRNEGRPVIILAVVPPSMPADFGKNSAIKQLVYLTHELALEDALRLGEHLNKFLQLYGRGHTPHEWQAFWEAHRPDYIQRRSAHFWISLEFWLRGYINITQSIQKWLYESFSNANVPDDIRLIVLEIAALSIERQPLPEGLIPLSTHHSLPFSILLDQLRREVPALALVRETVADQRLWAIGHDLLARYLLTSTFFDRPLLEKLGLANAADPVGLRLALLSRVAVRADLALKPFRRLAVDFAVKILKLDADGNQEFIIHWREVLAILEAIPVGVRKTSRLFNHHVAVSLRRVAKQREFDVEVAERKTLLERAASYLEYALSELDDSGADESKLNLYNSLALAYQDLADVESELGATAPVIEVLRGKASDATRKALEQDPFNSYVLETTAKNLIQDGEIYKERALACSTEALGYIYQALTLERSENRQYELTRLANRAIRLLKAEDSSRAHQLAAAGNPLGVLAEAWIVMLAGVVELEPGDFASLPEANIIAALDVLEKSPLKSDGLLLRLRYDLKVIVRPQEFDYQLRILDEIEGTRFRMPVQLQLEHAILLHQENRHFEANKKFYMLRQELKRTDAVVEVPNRLFWLRSTIDRSRTVCEAQVVETKVHRAVARVRELLNEPVPFVPQEFGVREMRSGTKFKCCVNFGRLGPFLKPPVLKAGER